MPKPVISSGVMTGAFDLPRMSSYLPIAPRPIVGHAFAAAQARAATQAREGLASHDAAETRF